MSGVGGVLADVDLLFPAAWEAPLIHRGMTPTVLAAGIAVAAAAARSRRIGGAVGVGYVTQLAIDATTPTGIPVAYPLSMDHAVIPLHGHSPAATVLLWTGCAALLWLRRR